MRKRVVSIEDIAKEAGVSHSTVSRALRDSPLISPVVRNQIQQLALSMGYIPNAIAQSLHNQQTNTIGLVVSSFSDPYFAELIRGVEEIANPRGLSVVLTASHKDPAQEVAMIENLQRRRVDGLLIADSLASRLDLDRIAQAAIPAVLVNRQAEEPVASLPSVSVDDETGMGLAVEHLVASGHRAIGYLGLENRPRTNQARLSGYRKGLARAGIEVDPTREIIIPSSKLHGMEEVEAGQAYLEQLLAAGVSAICCYNDMLAVGLLMACHESKRAVPEELSIVGYDDISLTRYVTPALTTVHQPVIELGRQAMQMILDMLEGRQASDQVLLPGLVVRASTGPRTHA
ncbi:MAG TPA: LacI family DNA-binding transcriptional regulator [Chloroflexia bacterium]|nr:LacI family DNA-binding transcriptional regulator [Chloroflexia bacterium]